MNAPNWGLTDGTGMRRTGGERMLLRNCVIQTSFRCRGQTPGTEPEGISIAAVVGETGRPSKGGGVLSVPPADPKVPSEGSERKRPSLFREVSQRSSASRKVRIRNSPPSSILRGPCRLPAGTRPKGDKIEVGKKKLWYEYQKRRERSLRWRGTPCGQRTERR